MSDKRTGQPGEHLVDQSFDGYLDDDLITEEEEKYYSADVDPEEMRAFRESQQNQRGRGGKEDQAGKAESGLHSGGTQGWQAQDSGMTGAGMQRAHGRLIDEIDEDDSEIDARIDDAMSRRAQRRRRERRTRNLFITVVIVLIALLACFTYARVLVPQDSDLPWPSFLGSRPDKVPAALSFLEKKSGSGKEESGGSSVVVKETQAPQLSLETEAKETEAAPVQTTETPQTTQTAASGANADTIAKAQLMAEQYDYDGAISLLQSIPDYQNDQTITDAISQYQATKAGCVAADVTTVPHIFYHSLVNDPSRAFNADVLGQSQADGFNAWMVTTDEFDQVTQRLYDAGYVYVRLRDLVVETTDADGTPHFTPNTSLMLPPGKKPIVLSVDDCSYYHSYEPAGFPDKLVLDENGQVKCHYVDANGQESVGDYDVVPRLNTFLAQHPDGCYKGARGIMAMTGYNGVFGYRTDTDYVKKEHLEDDQAKWLQAHPEYNFDKDVADAKVIAQALKDEGWEFASHTWGHLSVTDKTAEQLKTDNERWVATVEPILGKTDTIIFAHGNDIGDWTGYSDDNDKYAYYNSVGYHFYCNVDGSVPHWVQITDKYVRQGRIDVDGYRLWLCKNGQDTSLSKLIDTSGIFNDQRPTPVVANGQS